MSNMTLRPLHEFNSPEEAYPTALAKRIDDLEARGEEQLRELAERAAILRDAVATFQKGELLRKDWEQAKLALGRMSEWLGALSEAKEQAASDAASFAIRREK